MTSWLGTKRDWKYIKFKDRATGRALLLPHRCKRLPWLPPQQTHLLVAINDDQDLLLIYGTDRYPEEQLSVDSALVRLTPSNLCLSRICEFFRWPMSEAIYDEYSGGIDLADVDQKAKLADECLKQWNKAPVKGWCPVHRGIAGLSIMRNVITRDLKQSCIEIQASAMNLYVGTIEENAALIDSRIKRHWGMHDMRAEKMKALLSESDLVDARMIMRRYRQWVYEFALQLPF